jgi:hypothetical protein
LFISHRHREDDGFPNLEDRQAKELPSDDEGSISSVVRPSPYKLGKRFPPVAMFTPEDITELSKRTGDVKISSEVRAYLHNIVVFMRLHRAVGGGISAMATRQFTSLAQ